MERRWIANGLLAIAVIGVFSYVGYVVYQSFLGSKERAAMLAQSNLVSVQVVPCTVRDISPVFTFTGNLESSWTVDVAAQLSGRIEKIFVSEGDRVQTGSLVAVIDTKQLLGEIVQAEGNLLAAQASLNQAGSELRRAEALAEHRALSQKLLEEAQSRYQMAEAQVQSAQGSLDSVKARVNDGNVFVPRQGIVVKRYLTEGAYSQAGLPIVNIMDDSEYLAKWTVPEKAIAGLRLGTTVPIKVSSLGNLEFAATVINILPPVIQSQGQFTVVAKVPNAGGKLSMGMAFTGQTVGVESAGVAAVPVNAVRTKEEAKLVYVLGDNHVVQQRRVTLGNNDGKWVEVLEGLQPGEWIANSEIDQLRDGLAVNEYR